MSITPAFLYGVRSGVHGGVHFTGEHSLLYPAGSGVAITHTKDGGQELVSLANKGKRITALAINNNKKLIAFTEHGERPLLIVYDLETRKRRKLLRCAEFKSHEVVSLAFSHNSKYLLAQGGPPDYQLVYFFWEKGKVITTTKTVTQSAGSVAAVSFNPKDHDVVCIVGRGIFRMCRLIEGVLKPFGFVKGDSLMCLSHDWLSPRHVLVATEKGKVLLFEDAELKTTYSLEEMVRQSEQDVMEEEQDKGEKEVGALITFSNGFICSYGPDTVYVFEQQAVVSEEFVFKCIRKVKFPKKTTEEEGSDNSYVILSLTMSPKEDLLVALTEDLLLYSFPMRKKESSVKKNQFSVFLYPFHSSALRGLDICHRKPLIVTCSEDHTIRVWNYINKSMELAKKFREDIYSVAIHPSGLYIASGFADKIRLLNILIDDMRLFHEFPVRECRVSAFSHGGHLLVTALKDTVHVYSTVTFSTIHVLKGHQGSVTCVSWSQDDLKMVSCADNGSLYEWNVATGERLHEIVVKTCPFSYLTLSPDSQNIYAVGNDKTVKHVSASRIVQEIDLHSFVLSSICLSANGKVLVSGSTTGAVQLFTYPLSLPGEWKEWKMHGDEVRFIKISHTNDILVTASRDGSFCIWNIQEKGEPARAEPYNYALEILITKSELEEKNGLIEELKQKVDESKTECAYQLRLKDNQNSDLIKEINRKTKTEKDNLTSNISKLQTDIELQRKNNQQAIEKVVADNEKALLDQSDMYKSKLVVEYDKYEDLETRYNDMKAENVEKTEELEKSIDERVEGIKKSFDKKLLDYEKVMEDREKSGNEKVKAVEEILKQTEEDADKEILELRTKYEELLKNEKESNVRLRGELGILKKKHFGAQRDLEDHKGNISSMIQHQQRLENNIKTLEKDIVELKREIKGRDEAVLSKEKEISELKRQVRGMDKHRYVLNHKIQLLEDEIQPKDSKIVEMKTQILAMEEELTAVVKEQAEFKVQMNDAKAKLAASGQEVVVERRKVTQVTTNLANLQKEIGSLQPLLQDPKKLKEAVASLCGRCGVEVVEAETDESGGQGEVIRQKEFLESTVVSLKNQLAQMDRLHRSSSSKMIQQNRELLKEIDWLKKELTDIKKFKAKLPGKK